MKHLFSILYIAAAFLWIHGAAVSASAITLAQNGVPQASIVLANNATIGERHAAEELAHFLGQVRGPQSADASS
jgi:hypothetical protein